MHALFISCRGLRQREVWRQSVGEGGREGEAEGGGA